MLLTYMKLKNYKRLYLSDIEEFEYVPDKPFNIILGRNGSGKSSLLKEILPNVEDVKNDYDVDGYKEVHYLHKNKKYVLIYDRSKDKHNFIVDGIELNKQGNIKTQKHFIEEHFGLTKHIHELLLSNVNFTTMSISERKHWFTNILTSIDYEYALTTYKNIKERIKDITSYIKLTQSKLIKDEKLLNEFTDTKIENLKHDKDMLHNFLEQLFSLKTNVSIDTIDIRTLQYLIKEVNMSLTDISKLESIRSLQNKKITYTTQIKQYKEELTILYNKLKRIDDININKNIDMDKINKEILKIETEINKYLDSYKRFKDINELIEFLTIFSNSYMDINEIILELKNYRYLNYNIFDIEKNIESTESTLENLNKEYSIIDKQLYTQRKYKEQDNVECPKCNHIFKPNFKESEYDKLLKRFKEINDKKIHIEKKYKHLKDVYEKLEIKNNLIDKIKHYIKHIDISFYKYIEDKTHSFKNIDYLFNIIQDTHIKYSNTDKIIKLRDKYNELLKQKDLYSKLNIEKINYILSLKEDILKQRNILIDKIDACNKEVSIIDNKLRYLINIDKKIDKIKELYIKFKKEKDNKLLIEHNEYINSLILITKKKITEIETTLIEYNNIKEHYETLQKELKDFEDRLVACKKIEEYLSPTKGLIGESINNTINFILNRVNEIINSVWTYKIEILPCDISESNLTFRFPVSINNSSKTIPDIVRGSSSIKEVIDMAFKIVAMEFLNILDYPLILDEFGRTMDAKHRVKAYDFIDELSKSYFNQIFLVSHFESMYARFTNTDIIIIDSNNIEFNGSYNNTVKIKKI